jgi:hypothetical protein
MVLYIDPWMLLSNPYPWHQAAFLHDALILVMNIAEMLIMNITEILVFTIAEYWS